MLLDRFSSNVTPRIFFVTATPPYEQMLRLPSWARYALPIDALQPEYGTESGNEEQPGMAWSRRSRLKNTSSAPASRTIGRRPSRAFRRTNDRSFWRV